jgi:hypothetical protein
MRNWTRHALFVIPAFVVYVSIPALPIAFANDDAAHALAARFAGGAESAVQNEDQRKAEEAEILERARAEAAAREAEEKRAEAARVAAAAEGQARTDEIKRQAAALAAAAQANRADNERAEAEKQAGLAVPEETPSAEATQPATETVATTQPDILSDSNLEASNLAEKLKRLRENRPVGFMGLGVPPPASDTPEALPSALPAPDKTVLERRLPSVLPAASVRNATSITVLLVMEPGTTGIRTGSKSADAVICLDKWCYVSTGPSSPAKMMTRGETLGPINTLGQRAGACRQSLTCIYRGVDVAAYFASGAKPASMQPIDLRYLHHDRREAKPLPLNVDCTAKAGNLSCAKIIKGKGWKAWVIPEELAVTAGPEALQAALDSGLSLSGIDTRAASLIDGR